MNNNNDNKFSHGFLLGLIIGGGAVFLLGTKTGRNIVKIVSEQGLDGIVSLLEEYDIASIEEEEEKPTSYEDEEEEVKTNGHAKTPTVNKEEVVEETQSKRRFFKRGRK